MSKMTTLAGPPLDKGMLDRIRASVKAVATSPSASTYGGHMTHMGNAVTHMQHHTAP